MPVLRKLITALAVAALALPATALARHRADDTAEHATSANGEVVHHQRRRGRDRTTDTRRNDDRGGRHHGRHGADDPPGHR